MAKNYDLEIRETFEKKYLKVFLKDTSLLADVAAILRPLASVKNVNISASREKENQNLTIYPNRVYDINEMKEEVDFTLKNYFEKGRMDPIVARETISSISDKAYSQIVELILSFGRNLEKFQELYRDFDEEKFRDYFLPFLNTVSKNHRSTGETFNKIGKTDILIQDQNGLNVFIAECKVWKGPEALKNAIDQLLERYVTWTDEKVALMIFNKDNKKFSELIKNAIDAVRSHPLFFAGEIKRHETSYTFVFRHPDDPQKKITMELILFNCIQST